MGRTLLLLAALAVPLAAQPKGGDVKPLTSPEDIEAGRKMYRSHCANCHGIDGTGGRGPNLTIGRFRYGSSNVDLYRTISEGVPGTLMPASFYDDTQLLQLIGFLRTLMKQPSDDDLRGDPARGKDLFFGRAGCANCHTAEGKGGVLGPDLSEIGALRSPRHLRQSILDPSADVMPERYNVRAVTKDGETIFGRRLNDGSFSLQVLDSSGKLISLQKSELQRYEIVEASTMPSYEGKLSQQEIDDLVTYLASLRQEVSLR